MELQGIALCPPGCVFLKLCMVGEGSLSPWLVFGDPSIELFASGWLTSLG